jgi:putative Mg2+ transporter-C (MgtC) family protein
VPHGFFDLTGQGLLQLEELGLALVLSALIGLEREIRQKAAGLRTYTLVGVSACLFMLISKYGFDNVLAEGRVVLDPSRVAAQIVSGIGFIGGGVIFMRRDAVRGLTTAASVWLTAAIGMACGAGLPLLAIATMLLHVVIMFVFPKITERLPRQGRTTSTLRIAYADGRGLLRSVLVTATRLRFAIEHVDIEHEDGERGRVVLGLQVKGKRPVSHLIAALSDIDGIASVGLADDGEEIE